MDKKAGFSKVRTSTCLHKVYPTEGAYSGGIVFHRYFGIGEGIGYTKAECEAMWGTIKLEDHDQFLHTASRATDEASAAAVAAGSTMDVNLHIGMCVEVYWSDDDEWFPGIIKDEAIEGGGTHVVLLAYDDGNDIWHNMEQEDHRAVPETAARLNKLTCDNLRDLLTRRGVSCAGRKKELVARCLRTPVPTAAPVPATTATTTTSAAASTTATTTTSAAASTTATTTTSVADGSDDMTLQQFLTTTNNTARTATTATVAPTQADAATTTTSAATSTTITTTTSAADGSDDMTLQQFLATTNNTARTAITATVAPTQADAPYPGVCLEVYWDEEEVWFACIVTKQRGTSPDIHHRCAYDDGITVWHDLKKEKHRVIAANEDRLTKLTCPILRTLLTQKGASVSGNKKQLVQRVLQSSVTHAAAAASITAPAPATAVVPSSAPAATATVATTIETPALTVTNLTTEIGQVDTLLTAKCKFARTHEERMQDRKKSEAERSAAVGTSSSVKQLTPAGQSSLMTTTQLCNKIDSEARALYGLAARGAGSHYAERDGYNLLTYKASDLVAWGSDHRWAPGHTDMTKLPDAITSIRDVSQWSCVNVTPDGSHVVFKRLAKNLFCRGSRASARRTKFKWTIEMSDWFAAATAGLGKKSIPFVPLRDEASERWGARAPEIENLQNRIKSRDQARKEGRRVAWDRSVQL